MRLTALCLALWVCVWGAVAPRASAQAPAATTATPDARELFRRGEAAYSAGNYELAIREWNSAYAADPRPRIQFNLSQAYERLGQLEAAMDALKKFLDSGDPDDPMYSDANARLSALQQRLANTGVMVRGGREGGSILVDESDWGRTPRPDKISVAPGGHVLVVRWPDGKEFRSNVQVPAGQVIEVNLPEEAAPAPVPAPPAAVAHVDTGEGGSPVAWYAAGGGVATLGIVGIIYGVARGRADRNCDGGDVYCDPKSIDDAKNQAKFGYIVGGALVAGGAALGVVGFLKSRKSDDSAATSMACGVGLASARCSLRF